MIVPAFFYNGSICRIGGYSNLPYDFLNKLLHSVGCSWSYLDEPMWNTNSLNKGCEILCDVIIAWNRVGIMQKRQELCTVDLIEKNTDVYKWLFLYAMLFIKMDKKDWENHLMENTKEKLPKTKNWNTFRLNGCEENVFDKIEKTFEKEKKCLTDADFQANLVEWDHLDKKDWAYATQGYKKEDMLIFIKAGRTQVEQWRLAEALEKSYAKLVDSEEMYKIKNFNALVDLENIKDEILQGTYLVGAKPIDMDEMNRRLKRTSYEEMEKEVERLKAENEKLKKSPLETGVKWTKAKTDLLRIIDVLWEMGKIKYDGPEGENSKKMVFEKLGPAFGIDLSNGTQTLSNVESKNNIDNRAALKVFEDMLAKKTELMDEKGAKK